MRHLALASALLLCACTARYSHTLANVEPVAVPSYATESSDTGLSLFQFVLVEPESARKQLAKMNCNVPHNVLTDYREMLIFFVGLPRVSIEADCREVVEPE